MPATIFQHPNAIVNLDDPRDPCRLPETPTDEQWRVLSVQEGLGTLIRVYGGARVARWVRNLSFIIEGQEV